MASRPLSIHRLETGLDGQGLALGQREGSLPYDFVRFAGLQFASATAALTATWRRARLGAEAGEIAEQAAHRGCGPTTMTTGIFYLVQTIQGSFQYALFFGSVRNTIGARTQRTSRPGGDHPLARAQNRVSFRFSSMASSA